MILCDCEITVEQLKHADVTGFSGTAGSAVHQHRAAARRCAGRHRLLPVSLNTLQFYTVRYSACCYCTGRPVLFAL